MPGMSGSRFLVVTWEGGGNVTPVMGLGPQLVAHGHAVDVLGAESLGGRVADAGMGFVPQRSTGWLPNAADVLAAVEAAPPDALVVDFMLPSSLSAAERTGLPTAALVHTLYAPVADNSFPAIEMEGPLEVLNALRTDLGLAPVERVVDVLDRVKCVVALTTPGFDGQAAVTHPNMRYVGPVFEAAGDDGGWAPPFPEGDDRPLVIVSMGTTPMDEGPVLRHVLSALADLPVRVLAQVGAHVDVDALPQADNLVVAAWLATRRCCPTPQRSSPTPGSAPFRPPWRTACRWCACRSAATSPSPRPGSRQSAPDSSSPRTRRRTRSPAP
jgi:UDP:flavonoid glycosyltransferase YjiC (YdhE family)